MAGAEETQEIIEYDIPPYVTDFSSYFDLLECQREVAALGGFADIYSNTLGRQKYALKVLRLYSRAGDEAAMRKDFNFELNSWLKLGSHTNILELTGICYTTLGMPEPQPCFLSCWQENGQLNDYLKSKPDIDLLDILQGVIAGLKHMHERGVIHGDLRGGNILVSRCGTPRLADFGLSKLSGQESSSSVCSGTLRWMAREMLLANPSASGQELSSRRSKATDIWSMGMTILELLSGERPYSDYDFEAHVIQVIVRGEKPKCPGVLHENWRVYEDMLLDTCSKCWACDPSERPNVHKLLSEISDLRFYGSIQGNEDANSDESSLTPRARPQDDQADLLESIASLSLSNPDDTSDEADVHFARTDSSFPHEETEATSASKSFTVDSRSAVASSGLSDDVESESWTSDGCAISHMTAFCNHLVASKRFRKYTIHSESEGPDHAPTWTVSISIDGVVLGTAFGSNKRLAQDEAAKRAFATVENEEIDPEVPYLPIFMNRLNVRGSRWQAQFRWQSELSGSWSGKQCGEWISTLYWKGIAVGRGRGISEDRAKGEAARAVALKF